MIRSLWLTRSQEAVSSTRDHATASRPFYFLMVIPIEKSNKLDKKEKYLEILTVPVENAEVSNYEFLDENKESGVLFYLDVKDNLV